ADEDSSNKDATDDEKSEEVDKDKDKDKEDQKKEKESDQEIPGEQNLDGPWEPVGTVQTGKHVSKYEFGTDDWKEKIKAAESVMGLSEDEMTIWKIGGNGGPQQSFARVSKKGPGNPKYFIELKWIDGKGWKPVSVTKE
ncbi:MAG: YrrS family protein, partial [Anaerobacillus sp.]